MSGKILVTAAAGNVGKHLVAELARRGESVLAATRASSPEPMGGVATVHLDLARPETFETALAGVDRIYAVSPAGYLDQLGLLSPLVEAASARNIKIVLQTAYGVEASEAIPFRQLELLLEKSGTPFVILRPNWFSDNFATYWAEHVARGSIRLSAGQGRTSFIDARDIALAAAGALTTDRHDGQAFALTGPAAHDYHDAAQLLSAKLGRTIVYQPVDARTFIAETAAAGLDEGYAAMLAGILDMVAQGYAASVTDAVEVLSGQKPRSLHATIARDFG